VAGAGAPGGPAGDRRRGRHGDRLPRPAALCLRAAEPADGLLNIFYTAEGAGNRPPLPFINPVWWNDLQSARLENSGEIDSPPGKQWANRTPIVFPWLNIVLWGLGLPLGLAAWAGWAAAGWQLARAGARPERREVWQRHLLPFVWVAGYFLFMGLQHVKSMRYMLPIYPFLALFAAWALVAFWDWSRQAAAPRHAGTGAEPAGSPARAGAGRAAHRGRARRDLGLGLAFTRIYTCPVTRGGGPRWIFQNVPAAATVLVTSGSGAVPQQVPIPPGFHLAEDGINAAAAFTVSEGGAERRAPELSGRSAEGCRPGDPAGGAERDPSGAQILAEGRSRRAESGADRGAPFEVPWAATPSWSAAGRTTCWSTRSPARRCSSTRRTWRTSPGTTRCRCASTARTASAAGIAG
jgi:hypothetical protein